MKERGEQEPVRRGRSKK